MDSLPSLGVALADPGLAGTDTHCPYCALQCGMSVVQAEGVLVV